MICYEHQFDNKFNHKQEWGAHGKLFGDLLTVFVSVVMFMQDSTEHVIDYYKEQI